MSDDNKVPPTALPEPLRGELEGGLRFLHVLGMQTRHDLHDNTVDVGALIDELVASGAIDPAKLEARRETIRERETARAKSRTVVQVADPVDKYKVTDLPDIDCASLIPICKARCCQLSFPLTFQDLDERVIEWQYDRPYLIRRRDDCYCAHSDKQTRGCQVYSQRPAVCRTFDCRQDKRIWVDFEKRIPVAQPLITGSPPYVGDELAK